MTVSVVEELTGPGPAGVVGAAAPVTITLVRVLGLGPDPAAVLLLLVVAGPFNMRIFR